MLALCGRSTKPSSGSTRRGEKGNLDVFRHLVTGDTWKKLSPEDRMILEDKYRMWVGRRPGWDITLEPPRTPEADAFRKKFEEDTMRMVQEKREAERKRLEEKEKAAAEKGLAEAAKGHAPIPMAILKKQDEGEAAVIRQSLIQQIDTILQDPLAVSKEEYKIFLDEKVSLTKGNRPSQVIKIAIEERIDRMRNFRKREKDVVEALRNFKKEEFKRPKSPQRDDRNRGYERSSDRSRERSWERHHNDRYSGYARDTRTSEQKRRDEERIRREKEQREKRRQKKRKKSAWRRNTGKSTKPVIGSRRRNGLLRKRRIAIHRIEKEEVRARVNQHPQRGPYDQEWVQDNWNMDDYEFGDKSYNSKRSSSSESHRTPKSPRRMQSVVHSVCSTFKSAEKQPAQQMDEVMECSPASSNVIEVHGDEDMRPSRRNIIFDLERQLTSAETASNAPPESDSEKGDQKGQARVTAPRRHSLQTIELVYEMNDIMEQTNEICRSVGIAPDNKEEFDKVYWLLMNLRQVINDSGYAKEYEYGQWEDLIITQESANLHYFPTRECGLVSLIDLSLLETPLDTPDPTGMTQFQYRDIKERRLHVAQFVLRHVNPALRLLAGRAALGLLVKPDSPPDHRATIQKIFAARLGHYESHHQLRKSAQRGIEIPPALTAQVIKLGMPVKNFNSSETARRQLKDVQRAMNFDESLRRQAKMHAHRCAERIRITMGTRFIQPSDFFYDFIQEISVNRGSYRPELARQPQENEMKRRGRRNQQLHLDYVELCKRSRDNPYDEGLKARMVDARDHLIRIQRRRDRNRHSGASSRSEGDELQERGMEPRDRTSDQNEKQRRFDRNRDDGSNDQ
ncbi:uncharacterized protein LOC129601478 [Paramacrobiotus metropolitanus]|uniref:uncharacterized protein LOC129601478 n=1 Tax=Paramacrobiotus metropolitanus TaxID=2943436 RepID=UPI00244612C5|nr:uncharacterized protein LOC129601478 [Paramacrobiotus metropolitanus]